MKAFPLAAAVAAIAVVLGASTPAMQQRDLPAPPIPAGTAMLAGTVASSDTPSRPVRRARVTLNNTDKTVTLAATTDDSGLFAFTGVLAGRYVIQATKPAWLAANYGASRPLRPGTPIALTDGQQLTVAMTMTRGAVVTGVIRRPNGEPAAGIQVGVLQYVLRGGERVPMPAGATPLTVTDDTGAYRVFGLPPGETIVMAMVPSGSGSRDAISFREMTQTAAAGSPPVALPGPLVSFAPTYYPGTAAFSSAASFDIAAGEERSGIDIQLQLVPTATITGTLAAADGTPIKVGAVFLLSGSQPPGSSGLYAFKQTNATGEFRFPSIPAGRYTVRAAAQLNLAGPGGEGSPLAVVWGLTDVVLDGRDIAVPLVLQPAMTVSGRVAVAGSLQLKDLTGLRISVDAVGPLADLGTTTTDVAVVDGRFSSPGVLPGTYKLSLHGPSANRWTITSATSRGQETMDSSLIVGPGQDVTDVALTITDQSNELTGVLQDASGRPATDYFVIIFARDQTFWTPTTRRIAQTRPGSNGAFSFKGLPAGDYLVAAVTDVQPGEWLLPSFLRGIAGAAIKITVVEGQTTLPRLRVGGLVSASR